MTNSTVVSHKNHRHNGYDVVIVGVVQCQDRSSERHSMALFFLELSTSSLPHDILKLNLLALFLDLY